MKTIDRRLEQLEEKLHHQRAMPWWKDEKLKAQVVALMLSPLDHSKPDDPNEWTEKKIEALRWKKNLVTAFGRPVWLDGKWRWPQHRDAEPVRTIIQQGNT